MANFITWYDSQGNTFNLDDGINYSILYGKSGYLAPTYKLIEDSIPLQDGSVLRQVNVEARKIDIPILVTANSYEDLFVKNRALIKSLNASRGTGKLRFTMPGTGEQKDLYCTFTGGMYGEESESTEFVVWNKGIMTFTAHDPYFYSIDPQYFSYAVSVEARPFFPFLPMHLAESTILSQTDIIVNGDVAAQPVWVVEGPGDDLNLTNETTGQSFSISYNMVAGELLTIDTRSGHKTVVSSINGDLFDTIDNTSSLWSLVSGTNVVAASLTNSTVNSSITLSFYDKWLTL